MSSKKEALLYGFNYLSDPRMRLNGCWNDAIGLTTLLTSAPYDFDSDHVTTVIDSKRIDYGRCTRHAMVESLKELAQRSIDEHMEVAVVSFSGHGSHQRDLDGDELDGQDEGICPVDCKRVGLLIDDDLHDIFMSFNPTTRVYAIFDCCHSGSILDLPYRYPECIDGGSRPAAAAAADDKQQQQQPRVVMISGCRDSQTSADAYNRSTHKYGGALTMALLRVLHEGTMYGREPLGIFDMQKRVESILKAGGHRQFPLLSSSKPMTNDTVFLA